MGTALNPLRKVNMLNLMVSPYVAYQSKYFDFSFMPNFYFTNYIGVTNDAKIARGTSYEHDMDNIASGKGYSFFNPSLQIQFGVPVLKVYLNYGTSTPTGSVPFMIDSDYFSIGLTSRFSITSLKKQPVEK